MKILLFENIILILIIIVWIIIITYLMIDSNIVTLIICSIIFLGSFTIYNLTLNKIVNIINEDSIFREFIISINIFIYIEIIFTIIISVFILIHILVVIVF